MTFKNFLIGWCIVCIMVWSGVVISAQSTPKPTILSAQQVDYTASVMIFGEVPTSVTPNVWVLVKTPTNGVSCFWHGLRYQEGVDFTRNNNNTMTLTPAAIAAGIWQNGGLVCDYQ